MTNGTTPRLPGALNDKYTMEMMNGSQNVGTVVHSVLDDCSIHCEWNSVAEPGNGSLIHRKYTSVVMWCNT